jgi:hypothetical protein
MISINIWYIQRMCFHYQVMQNGEDNQQSTNKCSVLLFCQQHDKIILKH